MKMFLVFGYMPGLGAHNWTTRYQFMKNLIFAKNIEDFKSKVKEILPEKETGIVKALWEQDKTPENKYFSFTAVELTELPIDEALPAIYLPISANGNDVMINIAKVPLEKMFSFNL